MSLHIGDIVECLPGIKEYMNTHGSALNWIPEMDGLERELLEVVDFRYPIDKEEHIRISYYERTFFIPVSQVVLKQSNNVKVTQHRV